jgi:predicted Zn-dependent protease
MEKARYSRTEARIVYYSALLSNKEYAPAFPIVEQLVSDYPDNFVLYDWLAEWFLEQNRNSEGAEYFERIFVKEQKRSPLMAQYALLEKAELQVVGARKAEAVQTLERLRSLQISDTLLRKKVEALQTEAKKK